MRKIRVIIKRPDEEYGHVTSISDSLKNLQNTVEGNIEIVPIAEGIVMIVNEEGKLMDLEKNFVFGYTIKDMIRGTVIIAGTAGEELADLSMSFLTWKKLLADWGN